MNKRGRLLTIAPARPRSPRARSDNFPVTLTIIAVRNHCQPLLHQNSYSVKITSCGKVQTPFRPAQLCFPSLLSKWKMFHRKDTKDAEMILLFLCCWPRRIGSATYGTEDASKEKWACPSGRIWLIRITSAKHRSFSFSALARRNRKDSLTVCMIFNRFFHTPARKKGLMFCSPFVYLNLPKFQ